MSNDKGGSGVPGADIDTWRRVIAEDGLSRLRMEDIVAALQGFDPKADPRVVNALMKHVADVLTRYLRKRVGRNHPNDGEDIIDRAHAEIIEAVLRPDSADGKVTFREVIRARRHEPAKRLDGFVLRGLIPNYFPSDEASRGYATHLEWTNLDYVRDPTRKWLRVYNVRLCAIQYRMHADIMRVLHKACADPRNSADMFSPCTADRRCGLPAASARSARSSSPCDGRRTYRCLRPASTLEARS